MKVKRSNYTDSSEIENAEWQKELKKLTHEWNWRDTERACKLL